MRLFHFTLRLARLSAFLLLAGLALGVTTARIWLLPQIDVLKHQLAAELSRRIGQPVHIGRLRASLHGLTPRFRLLDVRIGHRQPLKLREIQVVPDLVASARRRQLQFQWLRIFKARIELQRDREGHWHLLGLGKDDPQGFPAWMLRDGRFELLDTTLVLHRHRQPVLVWQGVDASLSNQGRSHRLQIRYRSPGKPAQRIQANVHFRGDPGQRKPWQGRFLILLGKVSLQPLAGLLWEKPMTGKGDGQFWGHWRGTEIDLTGNFELHTLRCPCLHRGLRIDRATGTLQIHHSARNWEIRADNLHLINRDLNLHTRFRLKIPRTGTPHLEALGQLLHLDLARIHAYLPADERNPVKVWLRDNLKGSAQGRLLWRGRLSDFPFDDHSGIAEARLVSRNTYIRFHPHWPAISRATVQLQIHNGRSEAVLKQGQIAGIPIQRLSARLTLPSPDPTLVVSGNASAPERQIFALLQQSPLQDPIRTLTRWIDMAGEGRLVLQVRVPLNRGEAFQVEGRGTIGGPYIRLRGHPVKLESFQGKLHFDRNAIEAGMTGRIRHQPARLRLASHSDHTQITLHTRIDTESWPELAQMPGVTGSTRVELDLRIPHNDQHPSHLQVSSDLQGLGVDHPYPLGKEPAAARPFRLRLWLDSKARIPFSIDYPPFHAALQWHPATRRIRGRIGINQPPPPPQRGNDGLIIKGRLDRLALSRWSRWFQPAASGPGHSTLRRLELDIDQLSWHGRDLGPHRIRVRSDEPGWQGQLEARYTRGKWTVRNGRLDLRLGFLDLAFLRDALNLSNTGPHAVSTWPAFHLDCENLRWRHIGLGRLDLRGIPRNGALRFDFRLQGEFHRLEGSGAWKQAPKPVTTLSGRFQTRDLGRFLEAVHQDSAVVETPTVIDFRLHYPTPPHGFEIGKLQGHLNLRMGSGRWLSLEPGAGRLLGLLYLGTLQRRLRLDFSDLFARGLSYERIHGHIRLTGGYAFTDDLSIEAVPARIFITGTADLGKREINETVLVIPNTPLTLGFFSQKRGTGSVFQRLFNAPLDTLMQSQYAIYGSWDDPTIVRVHRSLPGALLGGVWDGLKKLTTGKNHESGQYRSHPNEQQRPSAGQPETGRSADTPGR